MEAPRLKAAADFAQFWRLRCAVAGDPRLRGEAKTAWEFLFVAKAGRQFTTIETSPEEIAADQGRDNRSGLRVLQALEAATADRDAAVQATSDSTTALISAITEERDAASQPATDATPPATQPAS